MPKEKPPTREDMMRAEKEIGENIPDEAIGLDTEDVGEVQPPSHGAKRSSEDDPPS